MKPNKSGIYEWIDNKGIKRLVKVVDVYNNNPMCLKVFFAGSYYLINDDIDDIFDVNGNVVEKNHVRLAEWPDSWGNLVSDDINFPEEKLYLFPD